MNRMTRMVGGVLIAGGVGLGSVLGTVPIASAAPSAPLPLKPGHGHDGPFCPPGCGNGPGNGNGHGNGRGNDDKGPWWANNSHEWWDDRNGPPPWGWGPPPPLQWNGGPLPGRVNYWGYDAAPVWNDGNAQWGIWLFGQWIPIFGVGVR